MWNRELSQVRSQLVAAASGIVLYRVCVCIRVCKCLWGAVHSFVYNSVYHYNNPSLPVVGTTETATRNATLTSSRGPWAAQEGNVSDRDSRAERIPLFSGSKESRPHRCVSTTAVLLDHRSDGHSGGQRAGACGSDSQGRRMRGHTYLDQPKENSQQDREPSPFAWAATAASYRCFFRLHSFTFV